MPFATKTDRDVQHLRKLTAIDQEQIGSDHYTILGAIGNSAESVLHELDALNSALSGSPPSSSPIAQSRTALAKILLGRDSLLDPTFKAYVSTIHRVADAFVEQIRTIRDTAVTDVSGLNETHISLFSSASDVPFDSTGLT